ncbi:ubiquitin carboxyl-terminal hydrolase family protein [Actinidia rufa]|uniref:Ubiquitin carboxyl-terminal hydrolase family protein n=1 Tax=Actinidia rufa TaxID=165716 RepID=A0A7J0FMA9_9ERIC|nr:ubiquitin carboxyl-terminal hydrolase family protein [Actinidia rufa]
MEGRIGGFELQKSNDRSFRGEYRQFKRGQTALAFSMNFPRGYGAQKKVKEWMEEFSEIAKTKRNYLRSLREELNLPHKFIRMFTRYPGIFYLSLKCKTTTVTLKEGLDNLPNDVVMGRDKKSLRAKSLKLGMNALRRKLQTLTWILMRINVSPRKKVSRIVACLKNGDEFQL